jgi:hypothetical protein
MGTTLESIGESSGWEPDRTWSKRPGPSCAAGDTCGWMNEIRTADAGGLDERDQPWRIEGSFKVTAGFRAAAAGIFATVTMDAVMLAAAIVGGDAFSSKRIDPGIIGRWAGGLLRGQCRHADITREPPVPGELLLGLATHYGTGIVLTAAFLPIAGRSKRALAPAVAYGVATSVLPLFVLFPSLGYGPLGVRSGEAGRLIRVMLVGHLAFGAGIGIWGRRLAGRQA